MLQRSASKITNETFYYITLLRLVDVRYIHIFFFQVRSNLTRMQRNKGNNRVREIQNEWWVCSISRTTVRRGLKGDPNLGARVTEILGGSGITNANTLVFGYPVTRVRCFCRSNTGVKVEEAALRAETEQTQRRMERERERVGRTALSRIKQSAAEIHF